MRPFPERVARHLLHEGPPSSTIRSNHAPVQIREEVPNPLDDGRLHFWGLLVDQRMSGLEAPDAGETPVFTAALAGVCAPGKDHADWIKGGSHAAVVAPGVLSCGGSRANCYACTQLALSRAG